MKVIFRTVVLVVLLSGCAQVPVPFDYADKTASHSIQDPEKSELGRHFAAAVDRHHLDSGFLSLERGEEALLWRGALADRARQTIDVQYFIWSEDNVGTIAAETLLRAAQRGVRVRVLMDDLLIATDPRFLAFLNAHPRIQIRLYNPTGVLGREPGRKKRAFLGDFKRLNRRMHNKAFVVDNAVAIIGGRNIADEYYDLDLDFNFRDRDVLAAGPIVENISHSFDEYWNSYWSVPVEALLTEAIDPKERHDYFAKLSHYSADPKNYPERFRQGLKRIDKRINELPEELIWARAELIYDIPGKNDDPHRLDAFGRSGEVLTETALNAKHEILAETPYLVLVPGTFEVVKRLLKRGVNIRILTNSFQSTDNLAAFSGYKRQRKKILSIGVQLYEFKAYSAYREEIVTRSPLLEEQSLLALHAKTVVFDRKSVYIGSFNMDPRSTHLNTEMGLLIHSPAFAQQVASAIERDMSGVASWRLSLDKSGKLSWRSREDNGEVRHDSEPNGNIGKRIRVFLYSLLPLTPYL